MEKVLSILLMFVTCTLTADDSRNAISLEHSDTFNNGDIPLLIFKRDTDSVEDNEDLPNDADNAVLSKGESLKPRDGRYNQGAKETASDGETVVSPGESSSTETESPTASSSSASDSASSETQGGSEVSEASADNTTVSENKTSTTSRMTESGSSTHAVTGASDSSNESSSGLSEADGDTVSESSESDKTASDGDTTASDSASSEPDAKADTEASDSGSSDSSSDSGASDSDEKADAGESGSTVSATSGGSEGESEGEHAHDTTATSVESTDLPSTTAHGDETTTDNGGTTEEAEHDGEGIVTGEEEEEPETTTEPDIGAPEFLPPSTIAELLERCRYYHPEEISIRALRSALALGPCRFLCVSGLRSWSHPELDGTTCGLLRLCLDGSCTPAQDVRDITACREFYPGARIRTERPSLISGWDSECAYFCRNLDTGRRRIHTRPDGTPCGRFPYDVLPGIGLLSGQCLEGRCSTLGPESE